jgi:hypothetical protein
MKPGRDWSILKMNKNDDISVNVCVYFCVIWRCKRKGKAIPVRAGQAVKVPEI